MAKGQPALTQTPDAPVDVFVASRTSFVKTKLQKPNVRSLNIATVHRLTSHACRLTRPDLCPHWPCLANQASLAGVPWGGGRADSLDFAANQHGGVCHVAVVVVENWPVGLVQLKLEASGERARSVAQFLESAPNLLCASLSHRSALRVESLRGRPASCVNPSIISLAVERRHSQ